MTETRRRGSAGRHDRHATHAALGTLGTLGFNALGTIRLGFVKIPTDLSGRWPQPPKNTAGPRPRPAHADPAGTEPFSGV